MILQQHWLIKVKAMPQHKHAAELRGHTQPSLSCLHWQPESSQLMACRGNSLISSAAVSDSWQRTSIVTFIGSRKSLRALHTCAYCIRDLTVISACTRRQCVWIMIKQCTYRALKHTRNARISTSYQICTQNNISLWHWRDWIVWCAHLRQHFVKPMKWSIEVDFDPARRACDILSVVLGTPALHKTQPYCAHLRQLKYSLVAVRDRLWQQPGKVLIVKDTQTAAGRYLTDGRRVKAVVLVAVTALNENARVTQTFRKHLTTNVVQM